MGKKKIYFLLLTLIFLFSGCSGLTTEDLYCLPEPGEDYYDLQEALSSALSDGLEYLLPTGGTRQEAVQRVDFDRDGTDEAVAFFQTRDTGAIRACIFTYSGDSFTLSATLECAGTAISAVDYADLTGDGMPELLLTCQLSEVVTQALYVYDCSGPSPALLLDESCGRYALCDLDGDSTRELYCFTSTGSDTAATVNAYRHGDGQLTFMGTAYLHGTYENIKKLQTGTLADGQQSLLVTSLLSDGTLATDPIVTTQDGLQLLTAGDSTMPPELTTAPIRSYYFYPQDIDGDGYTEFPVARAVRQYDEGSTVQYLIDWYDYTAAGSIGKRTVTYHSFSDGWYFSLPEAWWDTVTVRASDISTTLGTVGFYMETDDGLQEIMTVHSIQGSDQQDYVEDNGLTLLFSDNVRTLALDLAPETAHWEGALSATEITQRIFLISGGTSSETIGKAE